MIWWLAIATITVIGVYLYTKHLDSKDHNHREAASASLVARKMFHLVVLAVYIPGLVVDPHFLLLASIIAFAVLVVLEVRRFLFLKLTIIFNI